MSIIKDIFSKPKIPNIAPPPTTPSRASAEVGATPTQYQSLVSTGSTSGLKRKAQGNKRSLIGGSGSQ